MVNVLSGTTARWKISSKGVIKSLGVKVYSDDECTTELSHIDWGELRAGEQVNQDIWVKLTGNVHSKLGLSHENILPEEAASYLGLSWTYADEILEPNVAYGAILILSVDPAILGVSDFSFDIVIEAI